MIVTKEIRDTVMRAICDYYSTHPRGHVISTDFFQAQGILLDANIDEVIDKLCAENLITCKKDFYDGKSVIRLTDYGKTYFEREEERISKEKREEELQKKTFRHDWRLEIFSVFAGALLSRPLWAGIDWLIDLIW